MFPSYFIFLGIIQGGISEENILFRLGLPKYNNFSTTVTKIQHGINLHCDDVKLPKYNTILSTKSFSSKKNITHFITVHFCMINTF